MSNRFRVCLYNTEPKSSEELRRGIAGLNFVRLVEEVGTPEKLATVLQERGVNLVFFHLDPKPDPVLEVIDQVSTRYPELALIAVSHQTRPEAILAPIQAGCDQFVCEPIDYEELASAVGRIASKRRMSHTRGRCVCVTSASGGSGATFVACNLASEIGALTDADCALVDLDLQFGTVAINFDCEPKYTIYDLAKSAGALDRSVVASAVTALPCKVSFLARPETIEQQQAITPELVHRIIELLTSAYENVVVDLPRFISPCTAAALEEADLTLVVCQLLVPSVRNAIRYIDLLRQLGVPPERMEVVINRDGSNADRITIKDIEQARNKPVCARIPNDFQFVARSLDFGQPTAGLAEKNPVRTAIRKMARGIVGESAQAPEKPSRGGFIGRLLTTPPSH